MAFDGVRATNSANLTAQNYTTATAITFNTDTFDTNSWHNIGSNTSRITIPSGVTYVQLFAAIYLTSATSAEVHTVEIRKNGSVLVPACKHTNLVASSTAPIIHLSTPPLPCVAGDYFEVFVTVAADTSVTLTTDSFFSAMAYPITRSSYSGAVVKKAADQTTADYTTLTTLAFDAEDHDTDSYHDNATNNSRLTIPSGVDYVNVMLNVAAALVTVSTTAFGKIMKNGSVIASGTWNTAAASNDPAGWLQTGPIAVTAGDYFEGQYQLTGDSSITIKAAKTSFAVYALA